MVVLKDVMKAQPPFSFLLFFVALVLPGDGCTLSAYLGIVDIAV